MTQQNAVTKPATAPAPAARPVWASQALALVVVGVVAFLFFVRVGADNSLFEGHDQWVTGHGMLLSDAYIHAGFRTPLMLPVEDAYGPVGGMWAPYTGWPPLYFITLSTYREVFGMALSAARSLSCLFMAISAALVCLIAWRATRDRLTAVFAAGVFCLSASVTGFCGLVFSDVPALTLCLLVIVLYPSYAATQSRSYRAAFCVLVALGCLTAWQCCLVPVAGALAHMIAYRTPPRKNMARYLTPVIVAAGVGIVLIAAMRYVETHYDLNQSMEFGQPMTILDKLLLRIGWRQPGEVPPIVAGNLYSLAMESAFAAVPLLVLVPLLAVFGRRRGPAAVPPSAAPASDTQAAYYLIALAALPILWLCLLPQMNIHSFERIFWAPLVAVCAGVALNRLTAPEARLSARYLLGSKIVAAVCVIGLGLLNLPQHMDYPIHAAIEKDIKALSGKDTVIVTPIDNKGLWWRLDRSVVSASRLKRAAGRKHLILLPLTDTSEYPQYVQIMYRSGFDHEWHGYRILAPFGQANTNP